MTWLDSLETPINKALAAFPEVAVATITSGTERWLLSRRDLEIMQSMGLGNLPVQVMALPYDEGDILNRQIQPQLVKDVRSHLTDYFSSFFVAALYELQSLFKGFGSPAFVIGGLVRDMLLSENRRFHIEDVDIIVEGHAIRAAHWVGDHSSNFHFLQSYDNFGTAKLDYKNQIRLDFASTRRETYAACGQLPQIQALGVSLDDDLRRRDFTVNTLALSILNPGQVVDATGGFGDLSRKQLRLLSTVSFFEDPSRIMRALGFAARLDFTLAPDTLRLLDNFMTNIPPTYKGGGERIRAEMFRFFRLPQTAVKSHWLTYFMTHQLYRLIDTQLPTNLELPIPLATLSERLTLLESELSHCWTPTLSWDIAITLILMSIPEAMRTHAVERIERHRNERDILDKALALLAENHIVPLTCDSDPVLLVHTFASLPLASICIGLLFSPRISENMDAFKFYQSSLASVELEIDGDDLIQLGIPKGKAVGDWLTRLHHAKLHGEVSSRLEELAWVKAQMTAVEGETP